MRVMPKGGKSSKQAVPREWGVSKILLLGLRRSGKTTLQYQMRGEDMTACPSVFHQYFIKSEHKDLTLQVWDGTGGRGHTRIVTTSYYRGTDAIIFMMDSNDKERFPEVLDEIENFRGLDHVKDLIVVAMANKQDLPDAATATEMEELVNKDGQDGRSHIKVFPTTATTGVGVSECMDWLYDEIKAKHVLKAVEQPWKEVAKDLKEDGKTGLKLWNKIKSLFLFSSKV